VIRFPDLIARSVSALQTPLAGIRVPYEVVGHILVV